MSDGANTVYPFFGVPPPRQPRPALEEPTTRGKRVVLSMPDGFVYDMRAVSDIYRDAEQRDVIDIATEEQFYRWMWTEQPPPRKSFPAGLVWVE